MEIKNKYFKTNKIYLNINKNLQSKNKYDLLINCLENVHNLRARKTFC